MMEPKKEIAVGKFKKGYNCCQSVACSYCEEFGISEQDMFRMTEGFGSGMGGLKDTCGAVMGMFLITSLSNSAGNMEDPLETKMDTYAKFRELASKFKEKNDSIYCRDLLTMEGAQPLPCCIKCVEDAAELMDAYFHAKEC